MLSRWPFCWYCAGVDVDYLDRDDFGLVWSQLRDDCCEIDQVTAIRATGDVGQELDGAKKDRLLSR